MDGKTEQYLSRLQAVDTVTLTPLVRKLCSDSTVTIIDWQYEPLTGGFGGAAGPSLIYRYSGSCQGRAQKETWSLVLKIILSRNGKAPADPKYWKREYEVYRAGLLAGLPAGISAPRGYGVVDYPDESVWIWMEDIQGDLQQPWSEAQYTLIGRHFGQFNGAMPVIIDVFMGDLDPAQAEANDQLVFNGYMAGLRDAGWNGREKQVRLGYTAAAALKYLELICALPFLANEKNHDWIEESWGLPAAELIDMFAGMHRYAHRLADEARELSNHDQENSV